MSAAAMNIPDIETHLASTDPQIRMRGLVALREYEPDVAVPLLVSRLDDQEVMVRSFVALGLGYKQNPVAFETLTEMLNTEADPNVRAEAASALMKYGRESLAYVIPAFYDYPDWLMRMSVMLGLADLDAPQELFQLCVAAFVDPNPTVRETAVQGLGFLAGSSVQADALSHLLEFANSESWQVRKQTAISLRYYNDDRATETLTQLRQDKDYRVVSAVLEGEWTKTN